MNADTILTRLRLFLLAMAAFLFVGTLVELIAIDHTGEVVQWVPFVLCGVGLIAVIAALIRPTRETLLGVRWLMIPLTLGSLLGVWEHVENNAGIFLETHPAATTGQIIGAALGGANPFVAPGMLALAGLLAVAATYYHPKLLAATRGIPTTGFPARPR